MHNTVTISQRFPTWAAANEARDRLAQDGGFDRFGIDRIDIERLGGEFELLIRTDEFHRDQIEHLLRSSGTMFNPPAAERPWAGPGLTNSLLVFGMAAVAGAFLYSMFGRSQETSGRRPPWVTVRRPTPQRWDDRSDGGRRWERERSARDQREGLRSHEEGYAI
jgi:hypothetical protein